MTKSCKNMKEKQKKKKLFCYTPELYSNKSRNEFLNPKQQKLIPSTRLKHRESFFPLLSSSLLFGCHDRKRRISSSSLLIQHNLVVIIFLLQNLNAMVYVVIFRQLNTRLLSSAKRKRTEINTTKPYFIGLREMYLSL